MTETQMPFRLAVDPRFLNRERHRLLLPAFGLTVCAWYLGETENPTITACVWQFPLIAIGMAALRVCAISPRLPLCRVAIPGAAFIASIAYSVYLIQKLVINGVERFCTNHNIDLRSAPVVLAVELFVYSAATFLFLQSSGLSFNCVTDSFHGVHLPPREIAAAAHEHARGRLRNRSGRRFGLSITT